MISLKTTYAGLSINNPFIIASSGLTGSIESIKKAIDKEPGAIVLKSLFEEQILMETKAGISLNQYDYPESVDYIANYTKSFSVGKYLQLIEDAKKASSIPIIASVNCVTAEEWTSFAKNIEDSGADALELNISLLPSNPKMTAEANENNYLQILESVHSKIKIPITLKISNNSSGLSALLLKLDWSGLLKGIVMFNRHYCPDIDIANMKMISAPIFSEPSNYPETLRWVALMSDKLKSDISATTGIYDGKTATKFLLAGAKSVQVASVLYKKGFDVIPEMKQDLLDWMESKNFNSIEDFRGKLSMEKVENPAIFERIQFMKHFSNID